MYKKHHNEKTPVWCVWLNVQFEINRGKKGVKLMPFKKNKHLLDSVSTHIELTFHKVFFNDWIH